jgi:transcription initiation factor IIE alpha subunit
MKPIWEKGGLICPKHQQSLFYVRGSAENPLFVCVDCEVRTKFLRVERLLEMIPCKCPKCGGKYEVPATCPECGTKMEADSR